MKEGRDILGLLLSRGMMCMFHLTGSILGDQIDKVSVASSLRGSGEKNQFVRSSETREKLLPKRPVWMENYHREGSIADKARIARQLLRGNFALRFKYSN